jgi:hypothetical protein
MASQEHASLEPQDWVLDRLTLSSSSAFDSHFPVYSSQVTGLDFAHSAAQSDLDDIRTVCSEPIVGRCQSKRRRNIYERESQVAASRGLIFTNQGPHYAIKRPERSQSLSSHGGNGMNTEIDIPLFDIPAEDIPRLDPDHEFARYADDLARLGQKEFLHLIFADKGSSKRTKDSTLSAQARKRLKVADFDTYMTVEQSNAPDDDDIVIVRHLRHVLACPFYKHNPTKYRLCLTRADLRGVGDLVQHLWNSHHRPHYCPACFSEFETAAICDDHIRERSCPLRQAPMPDGLSEEQIQQLSQLVPTPEITEAEQWYSIWDLVFPGEQAPSVPYLSSELESTICELRHFWSEKGEGVIAEFLEKQNLQDYKVRDEERNLRALHRVVLEQMIDNLASLREDDNRARGKRRQLQVMETRRRVLGHENPDMLTSLANLASIFW